jgi:hypothetical protein
VPYASAEPKEVMFLKVFREGIWFFSTYLQSLEASFPVVSNKRLALEKATKHVVMDLVSALHVLNIMCNHLDGTMWASIDDMLSSRFSKPTKPVRFSWFLIKSVWFNFENRSGFNKNRK